jgi:hypothetical protein
VISLWLWILAAELRLACQQHPPTIGFVTLKTVIVS